MITLPPETSTAAIVTILEYLYMDQNPTSALQGLLADKLLSTLRHTSCLQLRLVRLSTDWLSCWRAAYARDARRKAADAAERRAATKDKNRGKPRVAETKPLLGADDTKSYMSAAAYN